MTIIVKGPHHFSAHTMMTSGVSLSIRPFDDACVLRAPSVKDRRAGQQHGAEKMLAEDVLDNPRPDIAYGLHLWNEKPLGWFGITSGPVMSASDIFQITVTGRGGHGALPHQTVDPVIGAAQIITALQSIISRNISPMQAAVISATSLHAGEAFNVVPVNATIKGTIRTFDPDVRPIVRQRFLEVVAGVGQALGCHVEIVLQTLTPAVVNDPQ